MVRAMTLLLPLLLLGCEAFEPELSDEDLCFENCDLFQRCKRFMPETRLDDCETFCTDARLADLFNECIEDEYDEEYGQTIGTCYELADVCNMAALGQRDEEG